MRIVFCVCVLLSWANCWAEQAMPAVAVKDLILSENISDATAKQINRIELHNELEKAFRATKKFRVLSRRTNVMKAVREEQVFADSEFSSGDAAESGKMENANFLIIPIIQDFQLYRANKKLVMFDDKYTSSDHGLMKINAQLVDTTTGSIKTEFILQSKFSSAPTTNNGKLGGLPSSTRFTGMAEDISKQLANKVIDSIFPMKVIKVQSDTVFLNRGNDGGLKTGARLTIFNVSEDLIDPDTGLSLGGAEEEIGTLEVTSIKDKYTIAKITKGAEQVGVGNIVRVP